MSKAYLTFAVAVASSATLASGQVVTNTWTGGASGDYNVAGNWSQSRVPGSDAVELDNTVIGGGATVSLQADLSANAPMVHDLTVNDGATLQINAGGHLKAEQSHWERSWLRLGSSGSGHLIVDGGTINVKVPNLYNNSTITLNDGYLIGRDRSMGVGLSAGGTATLTVNNGFLHQAGGMTVGGNGGTGIINQFDGELVAFNGTTIGAANSIGTWNLSGGEGWSRNLNLGTATGSTGEINLSGTGILNLSRETSIGTDGTGSLIISDSATLRGNSVTPIGSMQYGDGIRSLNIGTGAGAGLLKVIGNDATVSINRSTTGSVPFTVGANGTLAFDIDDATVSAVTLSGGTTTLGGVIDLGLIGGYTPGPGAVYDLITGANTITDDGFSLAAGDEALWSLAIVGTAGSGQTLQATYVPEPAGLALLGLAVPALLRRRRA